MPLKYNKRLYHKQTVYETTLERIRYVYKRFDHVCVSFSGGKDSTAVLNCAVEVARELNRLPVHAIFVDEEAIPPETIDYATRVRLRPEVKLDWYCLPVKHRNACSLEQPHWYCWNPLEKDKWVRPMPHWAITRHPTFRHGMAYQDWMPTMFSAKNGTVGMMLGIRTEESIRRLRMMMSKKNECYIQTSADHDAVYRCFPIYDWRSTDVWKLIQDKGYDYNHAYNVMNRTRLYNKLGLQRICQPYGEEPLRTLWLWSECWPDMWPKLLARVPGVATAFRYANSDLYLVNQKPDELTWHDYAMLLATQHVSAAGQEMVRQRIKQLVGHHTRLTPDPIPDADPHPLSGMCWRFAAKVVGTGDYKSRNLQNLTENARRAQIKLGITRKQAKEMFGHGRSTH